jgi:hypothetical protein
MIVKDEYLEGCVRLKMCQVSFSRQINGFMAWCLGTGTILPLGLLQTCEKLVSKIIQRFL